MSRSVERRTAFSQSRNPAWRNPVSSTTSVGRRAAFTLIEVLLVLVILGLLFGLVGTQFFGIKDRANIDAARAQVQSFYQACDFFRLHMNDYPSSLTQLVSGSELGTNWAGPYIEKEPVDPWENAYVYEYQGGGAKPQIYSLGPDGAAGTDDDVYREQSTQ